MSKRLNKDLLLMIFLIILVIVLIFLNLEKSIDYGSTDNIIYDKTQNVVYLDSLTLRQKIAQMIITYEKNENKEILQKLNIGGIHLGAKSSPQEFVDTIDSYQDGAIIPFFITVDMEGCLNPFENFQHFPSSREMETKEDACRFGYKQGELLKELGFSINFAPVVDLEDTIWNCRNFLGSPEEVMKKAVYYTEGLQSRGILATAKHYPGKTLSIEDPHEHIVYATLDDNDLLPFEESIKNNVSIIMISNIIADGTIDSENKPSVVSEEVVNNLRGKFNGLIITDDIRMLGLRKYYSNVDEMYVDLFKAKNDIILNLNIDPNNLYHMISVVEKAVNDGIISEERIDDSIVRILNMKGIEVIR